MTVPEAERDRVVAHLRQQAAEGRLDMDEFGQRLDEAYQAATSADLQHALRELPALEAPPPRPAPAAPRPAPTPMHRPNLTPEHRARLAKAAWNAHLGAYVSVQLFLVMIWLISGAGFFWPIFPIMGWGIGLASHGMAHAANRPRPNRGTR
jgi:hypothetical protein